MSSLRKVICFKSREFTETAGFTPYQTVLRDLLSWRSLREPISLNPNAIALPFRGGAARLGSVLPSRSGVGFLLPRRAAWKEKPHPNPSPEAEGLIGIWAYTVPGQAGDDDGIRLPNTHFPSRVKLRVISAFCAIQS